MVSEFKIFFLKLISLILVAPIAGYALLLSSEQIEKAWKLGKRKKKWFALTSLFVFLAIVFGWLR